MRSPRFSNRLKAIGLQALERVKPGLIENIQTGKYAIPHVRPLVASPADDRFAAGPLLPTPGITFDQADQEALVLEIGQHRGLFAGLRSNPAINTMYHSTGDKIRNGFYPTPDAETYAGLIAIRRPRRIIEIGGGFSTLVARSVIDRLDLDTELIVVDPQPRTDVNDAASRVILERVETAGLTGADFPEPSILFIDSSHILRSGGDLSFLYGELVPSLPSGVSVHVHDIYLPFDYSQLGLDLWWTEQYVLQALLAHSPRYRVELALRWMTSTSPELMAEVYGSAVANDPAHGGGSLWFSIV